MGAMKELHIEELESLQPRLEELAENVLDHSLLEINKEDIEWFIDRLTQDYSINEIREILSAYDQNITVACIICQGLSNMYC